MKTGLSLIATCLCSFLMGQTYSLSYRDWDTASPYIYTITLDYPEEPNQVELTDSLPQEDKLSIEGYIKDYRDSALRTLIYRLNPLDSSQMERFIPDENGYFKLDFEPGSILLQFTLGGTIKDYYLFSSGSHPRKLSYQLKLGRDQPFEHYLILSKRKLLEEEIQETIKCLKANYLYHPLKTWDCDEGKDFYISMTGG